MEEKQWEETRVPYLGHLCTFDGGDFDGFLQRQGWQIQGEEANQDRLTRLDGSCASRTEETAVVQAWLFFGVLAEVSRLVGVKVDLQDFFEQRGECTVITTHNLPHFVRLWAESEHTCHLDTQKDHLRKVLSFLQRSGDIVDSAFSYPRLRYAEDTESMTMLIVAESIAILGDSLMNATANIWHNFPDVIELVVGPRARKRLRYCEPSTLSLKRLEKRGWCKSTRMMMHRLVDCSGLYRCAMLSRPKMITGHLRCTTTECVEMNISKDMYKVKHVCKSENCTILEVDRRQLANKLTDGEIPCVSLNAMGQIDVCGSEDGYVALSHVWAHGLGNPNVNGLPQCQLERLQGIVNDVRTQRGAHEAAGNFPFWMDTLCIPVGEEYAKSRNDAILSLTRVFKDASTVLVIDTEVNGVSMCVPQLERELRVITCDWMRRVWTLQEALLTREGNLYWQFKEQALPAEDIWLRNSQHDPLHVTYWQSAFDKRLPRLVVNPHEPQQLSSDFLNVVYALRYRSLSRIEDETICIAPMLGLQREALLKSKDHTERIKIFLSLWKQVPSYILFMEGEHLEEYGVRWMPVSFVRGHHKSVAPRAPEKFTSFGSKGLSINYPGIFIRRPSAIASPLHCETGFYSSLDGRWHTVHDQGLIFESRLPESQRWATWKRNLHKLNRPAFIIEFPSNYAENYLVAALVDVLSADDGTFYARYICRVWMQTCDEDRRFLTQPDTKDVKEWVALRYEERIAQLPHDEQAHLRRDCPPPRELFEATALDQKWCVG